MAEQMGTPGSTADLSVNGSKLGAPKDKACPFCHQQFTSSSLGRHLDLYIKEKNPKPADGIHDVIEIRKLRGGITRRQPRNSTSRREDSTPAGTPAAQERRSPQPEENGDGGRSPSLRRDEVGGGDAVNFKGKHGVFLNKGTWESTGVMNNIPPPRTSESRSWDGEERDTSRRLEPRSRSVSKQMLAKTTFEQKQKMLDALDNAKASELALRELMGSIRAAKQRIDGPNIFDYDPLTLDFPSLCLHCLPPPPTLYSSTPIPSPSSWSILPPDETQYNALSEHFRSVFHNWHLSVAVASTAATEDLSYPPPATFEGHSDPAEIAERAEATASSLQAKITQHLRNVYTHWTSLPLIKRTEIWTLELARGVGRKSEEIDKLKQERDFHKQETAHLRQQVDELSRLQHPREFKLQPPSTIPFDAKLIHDMADQGMTNIFKGFSLLDRHVHIDVLIENVIGRWKEVVKEARGNGIANAGGSGSAGSGGMAAQRSLSGESSYSANLRPQSRNQDSNQTQPQQTNSNPPFHIQTQSQKAATTSTPHLTQTPTPTIAMDSTTLISPSVQGQDNDMDGTGSDIDADADADMDDDDGSYGNVNDSTGIPSSSSSTGFRLSSNASGERGMGSGMEGLESHGQVVGGYVRIGA